MLNSKDERTMKPRYKLIPALILATAFFIISGCSKNLDEPKENKIFTAGTDYTLTSNMIKPLYGVYYDLNKAPWECFPLISVRGDDVNAGGLGDQIPFDETDHFTYNKDYWMYNSLWQGYYACVINANSALEQIALYKANAGSSTALADQYSAEVKVMRAWWLLHLSRVWGPIFIPTSSDPSALLAMPLSTKDEVMQHISAQMDEAIPLLPAVRPNERTDIKGGVTKYTALALKALANLELKNYQVVADATGEIISSGRFSLESDYYNLFKIKGKWNNENLLEFNFTDFGQPSGDNYAYLYDFFGPQGWTPKVSGAGDGWGFWEPSIKYIKFMIDRGEQTRLQTTVCFTNRGIAEIKKDAKYASLPAWITNTTPSGDIFNDYARAMFASGKHYLPSDQLTTGRTDYGTNNGFHCIRYAEVLLMYAEALTQGASGTAGTADAAVNLVRGRAGLSTLTGVTNQQVMDEKFAELACEWGTRYYDMIRLGKTDELSYDGRTFTADKTFLPYPQAQVDVLPALSGK
jgi:starch-binding outer membrane protein, SusD/RagB family